MSKVLSRRDAVNRIARRVGYSEQQAEDIAQEAALQLIKNPNLISQRPKQAFVDAVRSGGEGLYNRAGVPTQPVYESAFEDYASFVAQIGSGFNLECEQIIRSELFDAVSCFKILNPRSREIMELYAQGFGMDEISKRYGISESRVCQIIDLSRVRLKAAIVSTRLSRQKQRKREWEKSQGLPRKIQGQSGVESFVSFAMEAIRFKAIEGLASFKIPKIPQTLFTSF